MILFPQIVLSCAKKKMTSLEISMISLKNLILLQELHLLFLHYHNLYPISSSICNNQKAKKIKIKIYVVLIIKN